MKDLRGYPTLYPKKKLLFNFNSFYIIDRLLLVEHYVKILRDLNQRKKSYGYPNMAWATCKFQQNLEVPEIWV